MNIVIFGAGAIGSLFGAMLSKENNVVLIGRKSHIDAIKKNGLVIKGKSNLNVKISAENTVDKLNYSPDLLILTVKSYDTKKAIQQVKKIIDDNTIVLSLQNGLDNIEKLKSTVNKSNIIAGVTTNGAIFSKPGVINHTGMGNTIIGEINGQNSVRIKKISSLFNNIGIRTIVSENIIREIWIKVIINSSINPLTAFFHCKNGFLLKNLILIRIVEKVCEESTNVANSNGISLTFQDMINKTKDVIRETSENYSSMLQSVKKGKRTEINSINRVIVNMGKKYNIDVSLNELLVYLLSN